jgi:hypothetical protein
MCWFVRLVVPSEVALEQVRPTLAQHGLTFDRCAAVTVPLRPGELAGRATTGHCDCDTELGATGLAADSGQARARKIATLRRKGWGDAKIERWCEETSRAAGRRRPPKETTPDLATWVALLGHIATDRPTPYLGLAIQWNSDVVTAEIARPLADADAAFLGAIKREVLYRLE